MGFCFECTLCDFLLLFSILFSFIYYFFNGGYNYWQSRNVPFIKPVPFFGNTKDLILVRKTQSTVFQNFYNDKALSNSPFGGIFIFRNPAILARDLDFIKDVMIKDFKYFSDRGVTFDEKRDPLQAHLVHLGGWRWKALRTKLTPTFTSGKIKNMYGLMFECAEGFDRVLGQYASNKQVVEIKDELAKFTTDIIGSCAFGLQFNSIEDDTSKFRQMGRKFFKPTVWRTVQRHLQSTFPFLSHFGIGFMDKEVSKFFLKVVKDTVRYREENNIKRNDMMDLLIQIKNEGAIVDEENKYQTNVDAPIDESGNQVLELDDKLLAAQAFVFFLAGFETSSTSMSFACYELALNPDIQDKLSQEIQEVSKKYNDKITYEGIQEMKYLDMIISETMRKFPPIPVLFRKTTQNYHHKGTNTVIEKGIRVFIPVYALQHDPQYYRNPGKFDPERFSSENKVDKHPMLYLPFGDGPRNCIGARFGLLQTKLGLATILKKYRLEVCDKTVIPVELDPRAFITTIKGGAWLKITYRQ